MKAKDLDKSQHIGSVVQIVLPDGAYVCGELIKVWASSLYFACTSMEIEVRSVTLNVTVPDNTEVTVEESLNSVINELRNAYENASKGNWQVQGRGQLVTEVVEPEEATSVPVTTEGACAGSAWDDAVWIAAASPERIKRVLDALDKARGRG